MTARLLAVLCSPGTGYFAADEPAPGPGSIANARLHTDILLYVTLLRRNWGPPRSLPPV